MDADDYLSGAYGLGHPSSVNRPVPRFGCDRGFDRHFLSKYEDIGIDHPSYQELRRAEWHTWKIGAPTSRGEPSRAQHDLEYDEQLARALAESARDHELGNPAAASDLSAENADEEELHRVMELSKTETRRRAKSETPEEERRALEQAMAASLGALHDPVVIDDDDDEADIEDDIDEGETDDAPAKSARDVHSRRQLNLGIKIEDSATDFGSRSASPLMPGITSYSTASSLRDVMGNPSQISLLIHSSFVIDEQWIDESGIFPLPEICPTIRICRPLGPTGLDATKSGKLEQMMNGEVHCYPKLVNGRGSEHMKFAWIFYKTGRLRVMIGTANEVDYDWERIENTIFVQDFLPLGRSDMPPNGLPDFPAQFSWLFTNLKVHKALQALRNNHPFGSLLPFSEANDFADMAKYDWSRVHVRIVMSVAGYFKGPEDMLQSGTPRLAHVLDEEGWRPQADEQVVLEYQGSSLGTYNSDWLNHFYRCASGFGIPAIRDMPTALALPPIKIVFPTLATVDRSIQGRPGGGTMFCGKGFNKEKGINKLFHDANSKRGGVLMHSKVLIALFQPKPQMPGFAPKPASGEKTKKRKTDVIHSAKADIGGWVYVGSHNFTPSAWGYVNDKRKPPTLSIANFEMGIIFPLPRDNANAAADAVAPHSRPPRRYSETDEPWDQAKYMEN
ncbi:hypothetical protein Q5752_002462 [Cryptotrichosporon argae]